MRLLPFAFLAMIPLSATALDEHSYARYDDVRVDSLALDLDVSFERKSIEGVAELSLEWLDDEATTLDLDTRDLTITKVEVASGDGWSETKFALADADKFLGRKLSIETPTRPSKVRVHYKTSPDASGLQWLEPSQTLGKQQPFMFSQSQAIHARSWVPLQDTPAVRFTYTATVRVPDGLRAVMSADNDPKAKSGGAYEFEMPQRIPSYLLAIAVGDLEFASLGKRTGVWSEPGRVKAAAKEFEDTESMVDAAEKVFGPYRWTQYDLLVLPPSFPFGGMENPRITFATPTIIAGDKSLVSLVAHELAHSWSGNLVTNASWRHFWLNEGFTVYVENRITEAVYGKSQAEMDRVIEETELLEEMKDLEPELQKLVPNLAGRDPDDNMTGIPYAKAAWLLRTLEARVGRARFDPFIRGWFDSHAFKSVTTDDFTAYLAKELPGALTDSELNEWISGTGIPKSAKPGVSTRLAAVDAARSAWLKGGKASDIGADQWVTQEWLHFLNGLPKDLSAERLAELDAAYGLTKRQNAEIAMRWYLAGIRAGYAPIKAPMEQYLLSIGRRKLVLPLYEELAKTPENKAWASDVFARATPGYHPLTRGSVADKLGAKD